MTEKREFAYHIIPICLSSGANISEDLAHEPQLCENRIVANFIFVSSNNSTQSSVGMHTFLVLFNSEKVAPSATCANGFGPTGDTPANNTRNATLLVI
jgi:hypothetical protein